MSDGEWITENGDWELDRQRYPENKVIGHHLSRRHLGEEEFQRRLKVIADLAIEVEYLQLRQPLTPWHEKPDEWVTVRIPTRNTPRCTQCNFFLTDYEWRELIVKAKWGVPPLLCAGCIRGMQEYVPRLKCSTPKEEPKWNPTTPHPK